MQLRAAAIVAVVAVVAVAIIVVAVVAVIAVTILLLPPMLLLLLLLTPTRYSRTSWLLLSLPLTAVDGNGKNDSSQCCLLITPRPLWPLSLPLH